MLATATHVLGAISWDPDIRNVLALMVGVGVLIGSVYLLVATNVGMRTGLLIALACLFGWLTTMGVIWWMYGIGMKGREASWKVEEVNYSDPDFSGLETATNDRARALFHLGELPSAQDLLEAHPDLVDQILPPDLDPEEREARAANITLGQIVDVDPDLLPQSEVRDTLDGWHLLAQSDRQRGDAVAAAQAFVGPDERGLFEATSDYIVLDAFSVGGKDGLPADPDRWDRIYHELKTDILQPLHPTHYAVVQVRAVVPQCAEDQESSDDNPCYTVEAGQAPPPPVIDERQPVISVVLVRDLGDKRFPAFVITMVCGALFALTCWTLHRRDAVVAARRAASA